MAALAAVWQSGNPMAGQSAGIGERSATSRWLGNRLDTDATLVERCLNGEDTAWEELVRANTRRVYSICYRFTGTEVEAQDVTQEVFLRVFLIKQEGSSTIIGSGA